MKTIEYTIKDELGIHARPAGMLVKLAGRFDSEITVENNGKTGSCKKIFSVMGLNVKKGDCIKITVEGADEDKASKEIEIFLKESL